MTNKLQPLPACEDPPVSEVAISVQFEPLKAFNTVHGGLLWSRFRDRFPRVEQHAPLERTVERTGVRASQQLGLSFLSGPEMTPRLWMLNQDSTELIQIQTDRFIRNWRRAGAGKNQYPRYESHLRPEFLRDFDEFQAFIESEGMGKTVFDQCEITYVNQISANSVWHGPAEIEKAFVGWSAEYRSRMSHDLEGVGIRARHTLQDERGEFLGRLFVELDTGVTLNPIYTLSARTALPAWVEPTASQIADLLALPPNWDSYGARPIRADRAQALWEVLVQVMAPQSPAPALVPVVDGSLQAEWHTRGVDLEIEATGPSSVRVYCRRDGVEWEDEISVDLSDLVEAIDAVTP